MKKLTLLILTCLAIGSSIAQTVYESPCVVEGKTFQMTIPAGFFEIETKVTLQTAYCTEEAIDPNLGNDQLKEMALGVISIVYQSRDNHSLEWWKEDKEFELTETEPSLEIVLSPEIMVVDGREIVFSSFKGELMGVVCKACYSAAFIFGDRLVEVQYAATEKLTKLLEFDEFKEIFSSLKEVETSKEDFPEKDLTAEIEKLVQEKFKSFGPPQENDLFETNLSSYDFGLILDENWKSQAVTSSHLIDEYVYKEDNGSIYLFSGGKIQDYPTKKEMEVAIQKVLESPKAPTISYDSKYWSDDYEYKMYNVAGVGSISRVYIAEIKNELVFFLLNEGLYPVPDFKSAAHKYVLLLSYSDDMETAPPKKEPAPPGMFTDEK